MRPIPPAISDLAQRLLAEESACVESSNGPIGPLARVCDKIRVPLTNLAGSAGFSSLMSRAMLLATRQVPSLKRLRVDAEGSLTQSADFQPNSGAGGADHEDGAVLIAELLGLLVALIGEPLTLTLIREAWPEAPLTPTRSTKEPS